MSSEVLMRLSEHQSFGFFQYRLRLLSFEIALISFLGKPLFASSLKTPPEER